MSRHPRLQISYVRFTSCSGCQLMLLNCESDLATLLSNADVHEFPLASSSGVPPLDKVDFALVEGSISTPEEVERLMDLRRRSRFLVAVGSCALSGGVNALVPGERADAVADVYGEELAGIPSFPPQPVHRFVTVDFSIPGCPPERHDLLEALVSAKFLGWPGRQMMPVCMECHIQENRCLLVEDHLPCLGPVTRAGCRARCPSVGVGCEGCRGDIDDANRVEMFRLLLEAGLPEREARNRLSRFVRKADEQGRY